MALHKFSGRRFLRRPPFRLFAVHCRLEDYRLAYLLNSYLQLKLEREAPQDLDFNYFSSSYSAYEWDDNG